MSIDVSKVVALGANYEITRNWGAACNMSYEQRDVSGGTNYSYDCDDDQLLDAVHLAVSRR